MAAVAGETVVLPEGRVLVMLPGLMLALAAPCTSQESVARAGRPAAPVLVIFPALVVK